MKKGDHLFLIDGSGYIFRAYHALPSLLRKRDGLPVGAVSGFCNMLWKLTAEARKNQKGQPVSHFAMVFDHSAGSFRKKLYPSYKANRSSPPEDLIPQFKLVRLATKAFNIVAIEEEGFEADDLIATYTRHALEMEAEVTIVSSDKDLMQLIKPGVSMYDPVKNKTIGCPEVIEKWGLPPEKLADLQALIGDSSDNIPGVRGIGPKTGARLIQEFSDLDTLLKRCNEIKQEKCREAILSSMDMIPVFRELVHLKDTAPTKIPLQDLTFFEPDGEKLIAFLKAMELSSLIRRVAEKTNTNPEKVLEQTIDLFFQPALKKKTENLKNNISIQTELFQKEKEQLEEKKIYFSQNKKNLTPKDLAEERQKEFKNSLTAKTHTLHYVQDIKDLQKIIEEVYKTGIVAFDLVCDSNNPMQALLKGIALAPLSSNRVYYIPLNEDLQNSKKSLSDFPSKTSPLLEFLKTLCADESVLKIAHNIKFHFILMARYGLFLQGYDDSMLMSCTLYGGALREHSIEELCEKYCELSYNKEKLFLLSTIDEIPNTILEKAQNSFLILKLWKVLQAELYAQSMVSIYRQLEHQLPPILAKMETVGIFIDSQALSEFSKELTKEISKKEEELEKLAGEKFNPASPKQLGDILFNRMNLVSTSKTKGGQRSTSAYALQDLADEGHLLPQKILEWRHLTKLKSTYTDALPEFIHPETKRIHTSWSLAATTTGRLASSRPNLQNIPARTTEGRKIRKAFLAAPSFKLLCADYSQIELRILAHVANIQELRQAFSEGRDIHTATASEIFGVPIKDMTPEIRHRAKAVNFGIIYGISAFGLAKQLSVSRSQASEYIKKYFERFPAIHNYIEETVRFVEEKGYVETLFGRRIYYPDINSPNASVKAFNKRAAINARLQGTASDIIRRAMVQIYKKIPQEVPSTRMLLQVHDELVFETRNEDVEKTTKLVKGIMENSQNPALCLSVPLHVDVSVGENWGATVRIEK